MKKIFIKSSNEIEIFIFCTSTLVISKVLCYGSKYIQQNYLPLHFSTDVCLNPEDDHIISAQGIFLTGHRYSLRPIESSHFFLFSLFYIISSEFLKFYHKECIEMCKDKYILCMQYIESDPKKITMWQKKKFIFDLFIFFFFINFLQI